MKLAERLLRISKLHLFDLYLFKCCLYTSLGKIWLMVASVERETDKVVLTFDEYVVSEALSTDSYAIVDDGKYMVAQRYLDEEKHYERGDVLRMHFEVRHDC